MEATISRLTCHDRVEPRLSIFLNVQFILFLEIFLPKKYLSSLYLSTLLPLRTIIISLCIQDDRTIRRAIDVSYRQFFFFFFFFNKHHRSDSNRKHGCWSRFSTTVHIFGGERNSEKERDITDVIIALWSLLICSHHGIIIITTTLLFPLFLLDISSIYEDA